MSHLWEILGGVAAIFAIAGAVGGAAYKFLRLNTSVAVEIKGLGHCVLKLTEEIGDIRGDLKENTTSLNLVNTTMASLQEHLKATEARVEKTEKSILDLWKESGEQGKIIQQNAMTLADMHGQHVRNHRE